MNELQAYMLNNIIQGGMHPVSCQMNIAAIAYGRRCGIEAEVKAAIVQERLTALDNKAMLQRKWQKLTRNPNKARHHDSIALREKYVRCRR